MLGKIQVEDKGQQIKSSIKNVNLNIVKSKIKQKSISERNIFTNFKISPMNLNFFICILILVKHHCHAQLSTTSLATLSVVSPSSCNSTQYFDISHLRCLNCPVNSFSPDSKPSFYIKTHQFTCLELMNKYFYFKISIVDVWAVITLASTAAVAQ